MSLRLHPEYGVNPMLMLCFWCGESSGVALLGLNKGNEAPRQGCVDYTPCSKCQKQMDLGITAMEAQVMPMSQGQLAVERDRYPTGRWLVLREEALDLMLGHDPVLLANIKTRRNMLVEVAVFEQFLERAA